MNTQSTLSRSTLWLILLAVVLIAITVVLAWSQTGELGAAVSSPLSGLIAAIVEIPIGLQWVRRTLACKWHEILTSLWVPGIAITVTAVFYVLAQQVVHLSALLHLLIFGGAIALMYGSVLLWLDSRADVGYVTSLRKMLAK